jgi:hypothetical protein
MNTLKIGRSNHRWKNNIKMGVDGIAWKGLDKVELTRDRDQWLGFVKTVVAFRVP